MIMAQGASVTVIDSNPEQIERTASFGMKVYYGDGSRVDLLRRAGAEEANLIVYCVNGEWLGASVIEAVRQSFQQAAVLARVFNRRHLIALAGAELNVMVREVWDSAIILARMALEQLGVEGGKHDRIELEYRQRVEESIAQPL